MKIKRIAFDLDGTLTDTATLSKRAYGFAFKSVLGYEIPEAEIVSKFGPSEEGVIRRISPERWEACLAQYKNFEDANIGPALVYPRIKEALDLLAEYKIPLGIVTGRGERSCQEIMQRTHLSQYFEIIQANAPTNPDKTPLLLKTIRAWNTVPQNVAYIGDTYGDVLLAQNTGVIPLFARWGNPDTDFALPNGMPAAHVFDSVEAFIQWIKDNLSPN